MTGKNDAAQSLHCPQCGRPVEVPESVSLGSDIDLSAFLREEGNTCLALTELVARLDKHISEWRSSAIGLGGYGSPGEESERFFEEARQRAQRMEQEIAALRARLHHLPGP
jgi:hypothetical protein